MPILAIGISHRRAPVELLERMAFADEDLPKAYRRALDDEAIEEVVILSTCNRVEIYGSVPAYHAGFLGLKRLLCEQHGVDPVDLAEPLYSHFEEDARRHLFAVAAGLDSMVTGEPQILAQVRQAHRRASAEGAAGPGVTPLFHAATRAGRRVRAETGLGAAPDAFVRAGTGLVDADLGGLAGKRALVIGAGQMAALAVKQLRRRGVASIRVLNRSAERARLIAHRSDAEHGDLSELSEAIRHADVVVSATGATGLLIHGSTVREAMAGRTNPMFILDMAVPRDIEPSVSGIAGVHLVDIDGLRASVARGDARLSEEVDRAQSIVDQEVRRFALRKRSEQLAPLIKALRERGEAVLASELGRFRSELSELTPDEREAVEALARGIVSKLLHDPIVRLKELSGPGNDATYARVLAELFAVEHHPE
ncbi:MAG TPA: glutamyl-tRNA reductase [Actinomycetota bacterium]